MAELGPRMICQRLADMTWHFREDVASLHGKSVSMVSRHQKARILSRNCSEPSRRKQAKLRSSKA